MKQKLGPWLICLLLCAGVFSAKAQTVGIFDGQGDIGPVKHAGGGGYDDKLQRYHLEGAGTNIWATHDEFHYMWKKMMGDFIRAHPAGG